LFLFALILKMYIQIMVERIQNESSRKQWQRMENMEYQSIVYFYTQNSKARASFGNLFSEIGINLSRKRHVTTWVNGGR